MIKYFLFFLLVSFQIYAQNVKSIIDSILFKLPESTKTSLFIYNPLSNDTIFAKNINESMTPASNVKIFTTAAALKLFSPDYFFSTLFVTQDSVFADSTINGDLIIKGFGNSLMTQFDLDSLVIELKAAGINTIDGNIIGDDSYFDDNYNRANWIVDETSNENVPPVSALVLDRNMIVLRFLTKGNFGDTIYYEKYPDINFINVDMSARITKFKSYPKIVSTFNEDKININVSGGLKKRRYAKRYSIYPENPALFMAMVLYDKLEKAGIEITGNPQFGKIDNYNTELYSINVPILKILKQMDKQSDNFLAECMFKSIGAAYSGKQGNSFYATQAILSLLEEIDADEDSISIVDGSGISKFNKLTAATIIKLLDEIYLNENLYLPFYQSLSIAGLDGTLKNRLLKTPAEEKFVGKTGTLNHVSTLSGYLTTQNNQDLIISFMMEFRKKGISYHKAIQDEIIELISKVY